MGCSVYRIKTQGKDKATKTKQTKRPQACNMVNKAF